MKSLTKVHHIRRVMDDTCCDPGIEHAFSVGLLFEMKILTPGGKNGGQDLFLLYFR